ncbi:MAG: LuxR C-terminal-related transcriptional regulator [Dehalococcoidia bacterium]
MLTPREWEVLALVERGLTNDEIADELGISSTTAKYHVSQILSKIEVPNRREARAWRIRRVPGLLSLLKGGAFAAATAGIAAIIYFGLIGLLLKDSPTGTGPMGKVAYVIDGDVWVKQLPNGPATQLTNWGDVIGEPQWSASGAWLSVARRIQRAQPTPPPGLLPGPTGSDDSTWIIDSSGKREHQVGDTYVAA